MVKILVNSKAYSKPVYNKINVNWGGTPPPKFN